MICGVCEIGKIKENTYFHTFSFLNIKKKLKLKNNICSNCGTISVSEKQEVFNKKQREVFKNFVEK